jgi:dephospho-CoA kinase
LGSGKSTVAAWLRELGAAVIEADELGRALMEPGQQVFAEIVRLFGPTVLTSDKRLNRPALARLAFDEGRLEDLNAIVHPAVIRAQQAWMEEVFRRDPAAVAVVESALIFEVERDARERGERETLLANWRKRIDRVVVVTAPEAVKIARYAARVSPEPEGRAAAEAEARRRLQRQIPDAIKAARADYVLENNWGLAELRSQTEVLWQRLQEESNKSAALESLE